MVAQGWVRMDGGASYLAASLKQLPSYAVLERVQQVLSSGNR